MTRCTRCNAAIPAGARFCPDCGHAIADADDPFAVITAPSPRPGSQPRTQQPGAPAARRSGGGWGGWILPVMVVIALAVIGVQLWSQRDAAKPISERQAEASKDADTAAAPAKSADAAPSPAVEEVATTSADHADDVPPPAASDGQVSAASLDAAFTSDPQAAKARYPGAVTVTGTVTSLTPGASRSLSLEGRTRFNFVVATLSGADDAVSALSKGQSVTLSCGRVATLAGTTMLRDCSLQ